MQKIIFFGPAGAGKTTAAKYLEQEHIFKRESLGAPLYSIARQYFEMKEKDRRLLQLIGQKFREIDENVWCDFLMRSIELLQIYYMECGTKGIAIDDGRQLNEHRYFSERGFMTVYIDTDPEIRLERLRRRDGTAQEETLLHDTEMQAIQCKGLCDVVIANNGTLVELHRQIDGLL